MKCEMKIPFEHHIVREHTYELCHMRVYVHYRIMYIPRQSVHDQKAAYMLT